MKFIFKNFHIVQRSMDSFSSKCYNHREKSWTKNNGFLYAESKGAFGIRDWKKNENDREEEEMKRRIIHTWNLNATNGAEQRRMQFVFERLCNYYFSWMIYAAIVNMNTLWLLWFHILFYLSFFWDFVEYWTPSTEVTEHSLIIWVFVYNTYVKRTMCTHIILISIHFTRMNASNLTHFINCTLLIFFMMELYSGWAVMNGKY